MLIEFKYPGIILAAAIAFCYFAVNYYTADDGTGKFAKRILFALKFIFLSMIALLIFSPELVRTLPRDRPVRHIVMFDNSRSMALNSPLDTAYIKDLYAGIKNDDSFIKCSFGGGTELIANSGQLSFRDSFTCISDNKTERLTEDLAAEKNVRSIILVTDGNFSGADNYTLRGSLPVNIIYSSVKSEDPDIFIEDIVYQDDPEAGDSYFTVTAGSSGRFEEKEFVINITEKGRTLKSVTGKIPSDGNFTSIRTDLPSFKGDTRETEFSIRPLKNEKNLYNNKKSTYQKKDPAIERILILAKGPSLDLAFLTKSLKKGGYRYSVIYENTFNDSVITRDFSSLIALGTPSLRADSKTVDLIRNFSSKLVFVSGSTDRIKLSNILGGGFDFRTYSPAEGKLTGNTEGDGGYLLSRSSEPVILDGLPAVVYNQLFLTDEKAYRPLLKIASGSGTGALYKKNAGKDCVLLANFSSFWKAAFIDDSDHFPKLIFNIVDLMSADRAFDRIRVNTQKDQYYSGEKIVFRGKILDEKLELTENAEAAVTLSENSLSAPLAYNGREYYAELYLPDPGKYSARVIVKEKGGGELRKLIPFRILKNDLETRLIGTDTSFVNNFASSRGGETAPLSRAKEFIDARRNQTEQITETKRISLTWNKYFFIVMALVFLSELAFRKYKDLS